MTIQKFLVSVHEDGRITAEEFEEPLGFVYSAGEASVVRTAYNQALRDVKTALEAEKARCKVNSKIKKTGRGCVPSWTDRFLECELLETVIEKMFRKP